MNNATFERLARGIEAAETALRAAGYVIPASVDIPGHGLLEYANGSGGYGLWFCPTGSDTSVELTAAPLKVRIACAKLLPALRERLDAEDKLTEQEAFFAAELYNDFAIGKRAPRPG